MVGMNTGDQHQLDADVILLLHKYTVLVNSTSWWFSHYVEYFYDPWYMTLVPLLKVTLRNGANVRKNQMQLFEVPGHRLGGSSLSLMSGHFAALRPFSTH